MSRVRAAPSTRLAAPPRRSRPLRCTDQNRRSPHLRRSAGPLFAKGAGDANANVMDKALEALCAWLQKADEAQAARCALPAAAPPPSPAPPPRD
jgi:hypothetical protein